MKVTTEEVTGIAQAIFKSVDDIKVGRTSYLRVLLSQTREELGAKKGQDAAAQIAALNGVHDRFYEIVLAAAEPFVPRGTKDRAVQIHAKANFARTAKSALVGHVRAGGDLVALNPDKVTKDSLRVREGTVRPVSARRWTTRAERQSKTLIATLMGLADVDKGAAIQEMQLILGQINQQLMALGLVPTTDARIAAAEHRSLRIGSNLFVPTDTQVMRQRARPS